MFFLNFLDDLFGKSMATASNSGIVLSIWMNVIPSCIVKKMLYLVWSPMDTYLAQLIVSLQLYKYKEACRKYAFNLNAIPSMFFIFQSDPWMRMLGMGNTFNFDGEDNYRHVIFLYSDLPCCIYWPTLLWSQMVRARRHMQYLSALIKACSNCCGSTMQNEMGVLIRVLENVLRYVCH